MSKLVHMVLLVALGVCSSMLVHSSSGAAETLGKPKLEMPGTQFGGTFRRILGDNPVTLDPTFVTDVFGGAVGVTVHGMPQIGQLRKGLWVASGFGRQGLNTSAMAGLLVARSILWGDERWRLFSPFELVWAGGTTGRVAGHLIGLWGRGSSAAAGTLARYREGARAKERVREARLAEFLPAAGQRHR